MDIEKQQGWVVDFTRRIITIWAMLGGIVLLGVVGVNGLSVVGALFERPFPGDFELTQVGVAIAVFAFLPYCQMTGANVSADFFTSGASVRQIALFKLIGSLVAFGFSTLLLWRMSLGMLDQFTYGYTTSILGFPQWIAYGVNLVSLALLSVAALLTGFSNFSDFRKPT